MLVKIVLCACLCLINAQVIPRISSRQEIDGVSPQPLKIDFKVLREVGDKCTQEYYTSSRRLQYAAKRSVYELPIENYNDISYLIDVYMGSDRQKATVVLDTGSPHVWLSKNKTDLGSFDPSTSKTAKSLAISYLSTYTDGTKSTGTYYNDTIRLFRSDFPGSIALNDFQFGVLRPRSTLMAGILGLAGRVTEKNEDIRNNNFVWGLKEAGYISKASFSLYLNKNDSDYGSVIFGGIDTAKYDAPLISYPLNTSIGGLAIGLSSINVDGKYFEERESYLLDLGTTLGFVSKEIMDYLDSVFNPKFVDLGGIVYREVSCDQPNDKFFDFDFGSNSIRFSFDSAISRQGDKCYLGFTYYNNMHILGDIFLRQAYVYYNLSDKIIAIAQAKYNADSSVIVA